MPRITEYQMSKIGPDAIRALDQLGLADFVGVFLDQYPNITNAVINGKTITVTYLQLDGWTKVEEYEGESCVCGDIAWGGRTGHHNEAGGYCCPHYGNTCGLHYEYS